jgi:hypothetical protein
LGDSRIGAGVIEAGKLRMFAMDQAIAVRQDFTPAELRRLATRTKDVGWWRRRAVAGDSGDPGWAPRAEAARIGGQVRKA